MQSLEAVDVRCSLVVDQAVTVSYENNAAGQSQFIFGRDDERGDFDWIWRDAQKATNDFLEANGPGGLLRVFRKYGPLRKDMRRLSLDRAQEAQRLALLMRSRGSYKQLEQFSAFVEDALQRGAYHDEDCDLLIALPAFRPSWSSPLRLDAECEDLTEALCLTLFLDKANNRERLRCQRQDCGRIFARALGVKHAMYCSRDCAQRVADRNYKTRQKRANSGRER